MRGKGGRQDRLPLPADVGEAIAAWLARRPPVRERRRCSSAPLPPTRAAARGGVGGGAPGVRRAGLGAVGAAPAAAHRRDRDCCEPARRWPRSARCCGTAGWPPPPSTPRSTSRALRQLPPVAGERGDEPRSRPRLDDYLGLRRALGFKLETRGRLLADFVGFADRGRRRHVTVERPLEWALRAAATAPSGWRSGSAWCGASPATCTPSTRPPDPPAGLLPPATAGRHPVPVHRQLTSPR